MTTEKILFVCAGNASRSPSFENWFKEHRPQYEVRSAGTNWGCQVELTDELMEWADKVYLMDLSIELTVARNFPEYVHKCEVVGISDQYVPNSPEIKNLIWYWAKKKGL